MGIPPAGSVKWSVAILTVAVVVASAAFAFNAPTSKRLEFEIACERFPIVGALSFTLSQGPTELSAVVADGFQGRATGIERIAVNRPNQPELLKSAATFEMDPPAADQESSHLELVRSGALGRLSLVAQEPAVLLGTTTAGGGAPWMTVESHEEDDTTITINSARILIEEANRYVVPQLAANIAIPQLSAELTSPTLVALTLRSKAKPRTFASIVFRATDMSLPILTGPQNLTAGSPLVFARAMNPVLRLDNKRVEGIPADQRVALTIEYSTATISSLTVVNDADRRGLPALMITGSATATSLRLDGRELITTRLDEILNEPVASRTTSLLILGVVAALFVKIVNHALGVVLDRLIPKG